MTEASRVLCLRVSISGYDKDIYHLLSYSFGQCIAITEIVDFNIFYVIAICDIHLSINVVRGRVRGGRRSRLCHRT